MLSLGLPLSVLGQEQPMFFKMFACVCLWLKFGSIIRFLLSFGGMCVVFRNFSLPLQFFEWVIDQLLLGFLSFLQFLMSPCLITFCIYSSFPFFPHHLPGSPHHPSFQILLYSQNCFTDEKNSIGMLHKSRKYKYTFLPHWPVRHFPYLAASLSHLITIRPNNNTTEPVKDTDSHTWAHNTIQHWPTALFHWTNT